MVLKLEHGEAHPMSRADKKRRHEAKRAAKRQAFRRRESVGPLKRVADARGEAECWMSDDFEGTGQAQLFAYKQGGGLAGAACFLIDQGVVGLKDAWTRMGMDRDEFDEMLKSSGTRGIPMRRIEPQAMRRWIAGAARWAHDHGMRLPKDWIKTASLIGGVGDWQSADVSAFSKEFAGHPEDLRQRLIGESLETFLKRDDLKFIFSDAAPYRDQRTDEFFGSKDPFELEEDADEDEEAIDAMPDEAIKELSERLSPTAAALAAQTADWLATRSDAPSPQLNEAWRSVILASMLSKVAMPDVDDGKVASFGHELLRGLSERVEPARREEYEHAVDQVSAHLKVDPLLMQKAVMEHGLDGVSDDNVS
jgi:hypothetical protein